MYSRLRPILPSVLYRETAQVVGTCLDENNSYDTHYIYTEPYKHILKKKLISFMCCNTVVMTLLSTQSCPKQYFAKLHVCSKDDLRVLLNNRSQLGGLG